jgi:hypothetical protein
MRKVILALMVTGCFLTGCKKQCVQPFQPDEIPALKTNDYNSCEAVCKNYTFLICGGETSFPYWSHKGDTIMVCGYIYEDWDGSRHLFPIVDSPNNVNEHKFLLYINTNGSSVQLPEEVDMSKKCYIKGRLNFNALYTNGGPYYMIPAIGDIQELFFE